MIDVCDLTKEFKTGDRTVTAVDHLSFSVQPGEVYGLLGPNGAGKTTSMRMILGLISPTSGEASVGGFQVSRDPDEVKRRIGFGRTPSCHSALFGAFLLPVHQCREL